MEAGEAGGAQGLPVAVKMRVVLVEHSPAEGAVDVEAVVAGLAKGRFLVSGVFVRPDASSAADALRGAGVQTAAAEQGAVEVRQLAERKGLPAVIAFIVAVYVRYLPK